MSALKFEFPEKVEDYLSEHNVMNLSTYGEDGPWSSAVFFAHKGRRFWFMSTQQTRHGTDIAASGVLAATIHEDYAEWQDIKGLQMSGRVWVVSDGDELKSGLRAYFRKYSFAEAFFRGQAPKPVKERMKHIRLFCFEPDLILWLDNSTGFGNQVQLYPEPG